MALEQNSMRLVTMAMSRVKQPLLQQRARAEVCKSAKRHDERVKVKIYAHAENALTQFKGKYQH